MDRETPRKFATPPGTRDVLPPESTRLLDVQARIRDRFNLFGFREVLTPALEYSEVIEEHGLRDVSYKLFDQDNQMLFLRPEMTTPIARLISKRLAPRPPPRERRTRTECGALPGRRRGRRLSESEGRRLHHSASRRRTAEPRPQRPC